jgi:hypothetical protein
MHYLIRGRKTLMQPIGLCGPRLWPKISNGLGRSPKERRSKSTRQSHGKVVDWTKQEGEEYRNRHGRNSHDPSLLRSLKAKGSQQVEAADRDRIDDSGLHQVERNETQPRKSPTLFSNRRLAGANSATPATRQTGAATYFKCDHGSGSRVSINPTAHSTPPAILREFELPSCRKTSAMRTPAMNSEKNGA